ncbi:MAG: NYN domain-containing protein [Candidatus Pacearchaeota archaeon]
MDKTAIFVDLGYLNSITKKLGELKIDFDKFIKSFIDENSEELYRVYCYYCYPYQSNPPTPEEKLRKSNVDRFMQRLKKIPRFEIRLGKLSKTKRGDYVQKRVDTYFAIDLVKLAVKGIIKNAIIIAGDSDFVPPIIEAKENGVIVKLFYYRDTIQDELLACCDERKELTAEFLNEVRYNSSKSLLGTFNCDNLKETL